MTTIEERLAEQLDAKDHKIERLAEKLEEAEAKIEQLLRGIRGAWSLPREIQDENPELPVPRLEIVWIKSPDGWHEHEVEYRLVHRHFLGHLVVVPLGLTRVSGGSRDDEPWKWSVQLHGRPDLPFRDGAHARHDAAHLGIPLFAIAGGVSYSFSAVVWGNNNDGAQTK